MPSAKSANRRKENNSIDTIPWKVGYIMIFRTVNVSYTVGYDICMNVSVLCMTTSMRIVVVKDDMIETTISSSGFGTRSAPVENSTFLRYNHATIGNIMRGCKCIIKTPVLMKSFCTCVTTMISSRTRGRSGILDHPEYWTTLLK